MIIRSKAPFRIGLAGGGTDVSPFTERYGGFVVNAAIDLFAYATLEPLDNGFIEFCIGNPENCIKVKSEAKINPDKNFELLIGVYNRIVTDFNTGPLSFRLTTFMEAPQGSGLGTSSTIVVSVLGAFAEWLNLPLGPHDIAKLAWEIERKDLNIKGGKQDQYAAVFGGINFLDFHKSGSVIVNPLPLKPEVVNELELNLLLYFTDTRRNSSEIISEQVQNVVENDQEAIEAMLALKDQAIQIKNALLTGDLDHIGEILDFGWQNKKRMANQISNENIDSIYQTAINNGATGGKISGAGGGGFMFFYCPGNTKAQVATALEKSGGKVQSFKFSSQGLTTWIAP